MSEPLNQSTDVGVTNLAMPPGDTARPIHSLLLDRSVAYATASISSLLGVKITQDIHDLTITDATNLYRRVAAGKKPLERAAKVVLERAMIDAAKAGQRAIPLRLNEGNVADSGYQFDIEAYAKAFQPSADASVTVAEVVKEPVVETEEDKMFAKVRDMADKTITATELDLPIRMENSPYLKEYRSDPILFLAARYVRAAYPMANINRETSSKMSEIPDYEGKIDYATTLVAQQVIRMWWGRMNGHPTWGGATKNDPDLKKMDAFVTGSQAEINALKILLKPAIELMNVIDAAQHPTQKI